MHALARVWARLEEGLIAFLLAAMTLVTFVYVVLNNLYTLLYDLADLWEAATRRCSPSAMGSSPWPRR